MGETLAKLKLTFGTPWRSTDEGDTALWPSDEITILRRAGSHYFCRVVYGNREFLQTMHGWIHKRLLRVPKVNKIDMGKTTSLDRLRSEVPYPYPSDPYETFEIWMRGNGFEDVADSQPADVDLDRLNEAIAAYGAA